MMGFMRESELRLCVLYTDWPWGREIYDNFHLHVILYTFFVVVFLEIMDFEFFRKFVNKISIIADKLEH